MVTAPYLLARLSQFPFIRDGRITLRSRRGGYSLYDAVLDQPIVRIRPIGADDQVALLYPDPTKAAGDLARALERCRQSAGLYREIGDGDKLQAELGRLASIQHSLGDAAGALAALAEKEAICRHFEQPRNLVGALMAKAVVLQGRQDVSGAREAVAEALRLTEAHQMADLTPKVRVFLAKLF